MIDAAYHPHPQNCNPKLNWLGCARARGIRVQIGAKLVVDEIASSILKVHEKIHSQKSKTRFARSNVKEMINPVPTGARIRSRQVTEYSRAGLGGDFERGNE